MDLVGPVRSLQRTVRLANESIAKTHSSEASLFIVLADSDPRLSNVEEEAAKADRHHMVPPFTITSSSSSSSTMDAFLDQRMRQDSVSTTTECHQRLVHREGDVMRAALVDMGCLSTVAAGQGSPSSYQTSPRHHATNGVSCCS